LYYQFFRLPAACVAEVKIRMRLAVVAIVKDEARYIQEWLAHYALLGFGDVLIYNNEGTDRTVALAQAAQGLRVETLEWPYRDSGSAQVSAYNDAIARRGDAFDFMGFFDIDEFLLPTADKTLVDILAALPADAGAVGVNQRIFGSSGRVRREPGLVVERFRHCAEPDYEEHVWPKSIYRPSCVREILTPHIADLSSGRYVHADGRDLAFRELTFDGGLTAPVAPVDFSLLQLNHYMLKSEEEFFEKQAKGCVEGRTPEERRKRYETSYFRWREPYVNKIVDERAARLAPAIAAKIAELWPETQQVQTRAI